MPGDEVADRAVGAHAQARGGQRVLQVVAEAAQHLQLEVAVVAAERRLYGDRVGDRAQVVATRSRADPRRPRASSRRTVSASKLRSQSALTLEDRRRPAVLARLDDLVVPVGALDEPDDERRARAASRRPRR